MPAKGCHFVLGCIKRRHTNTSRPRPAGVRQISSHRSMRVGVETSQSTTKKMSRPPTAIMETKEGPPIIVYSRVPAGQLSSSNARVAHLISNVKNKSRKSQATRRFTSAVECLKLPTGPQYDIVRLHRTTVFGSAPPNANSPAPKTAILCALRFRIPCSRSPAKFGLVDSATLSSP